MSVRCALLLAAYFNFAGEIELSRRRVSTIILHIAQSIMQASGPTVFYNVRSAGSRVTFTAVSSPFRHTPKKGIHSNRHPQECRFFATCESSTSNSLRSATSPVNFCHTQEALQACKNTGMFTLFSSASNTADPYCIWALVVLFFFCGSYARLKSVLCTEKQEEGGLRLSWKRYTLVLFEVVGTVLDLASSPGLLFLWYAHARR